jgi:hypothetical protein
MGWLGSLLGARKVDSWELLKEAAKAETARVRVEIERTPRASAEAITECASQLGDFDSLNYFYNNMRRDDFCESALLALKSGTLEESQFNLVMYTREWVLTGSDNHIDFPSWLQGAGKQRFAVDLSSQWINSGHREMSFEQWYVHVKSDLR